MQTATVLVLTTRENRDHMEMISTE
jgi:hypothetical protein